MQPALSSLPHQSPLLSVDERRYEVRVGGERLRCTLSEYRIVLTLTRDPGRVFTRDELRDVLTQGTFCIIERNVDVHVNAIRRKLRQHRWLIETVRGVGYRLAEGADA